MLRESIAIRSIAFPASPCSNRPPVTAAMSPAVSGNRSTRYDTLARERLRASASRATSTSSNGSVRSPIC